MVENAVSSVSGVKETKVAVVWEPPWDPAVCRTRRDSC
jgi:metal-sulfur cluster biosynthetic enzyme